MSNLVMVHVELSPIERYDIETGRGVVGRRGGFGREV